MANKYCKKYPPDIADGNVTIIKPNVIAIMLYVIFLRFRQLSIDLDTLDAFFAYIVLYIKRIFASVITNDGIIAYK